MIEQEDSRAIIAVIEATSGKFGEESQFEPGIEDLRIHEPMRL
jgi:hypothetical protein